MNALLGQEQPGDIRLPATGPADPRLGTRGKIRAGVDILKQKGVGGPPPRRSY